MKKLALIFSEFLVRLGIALLRDRVTTDLRKTGFTPAGSGVWSKPHAGDEDDGDRLTSIHEATAITSLVQIALRNIYTKPSDL